MSISPKSRFLGVEHQVIVKKGPPFFLGGVLHWRVKVRNLKPKPVNRRFCYILDYPGGMVQRKKEFNLEPNEERVYSFQPRYLQFMGSFRIALLIGELGRKLNEEDIDKLSISPNDLVDFLFAGNVRDKDSYKLQSRMLYLTIAIAVLAAAEILTLVIG